MAAGDDQDAMRDAMLRADMLRQQLASLEAQRELFADLVQEAARSATTLEGVAAQKEGDEILVPVGAGAFLHARLADTRTAIASIGSNVHAEMPLEDARRRLEERVESLQSANKRLSADIARIVDELTRINALLDSQVA